MSILREKAGYFPLNAQIFCSPFLPGDTRTKIMQQKHKWLRACIWNFATLIKTLKGLQLFTKCLAHIHSVFFINFEPFSPLQGGPLKKDQGISKLQFKKFTPFYGQCSTTSKLQSNYETVISHYISLCIILSKTLWRFRNLIKFTTPFARVTGLKLAYITQ